VVIFHHFLGVGKIHRLVQIQQNVNPAPPMLFSIPLQLAQSNKIYLRSDLLALLLIEVRILQEFLFARGILCYLEGNNFIFAKGEQPFEDDLGRHRRRTKNCDGLAFQGFFQHANI
jgi:hypothetical protein